MREMRRAFLIAGTTLLLSACGFELRGSSPSSQLPFSTLYIESQLKGAAANNSVAIELKRRLSRSGSTTVVDDPKLAEATVQIMSEVRDRVILSLNSQGRVREYTLNYRVTFRVLDNAKRELRPAEVVTVYRNMTFNESQVLAKEGEEQSLYRDMQADMVGQLLRRVAATRPLPPVKPEAQPQQPQQNPATNPAPQSPQAPATLAPR